MILHTGNKIPLMCFNSKEEAETALLNYQKAIEAEIKNLGYDFENLLKYLKEYIHVLKSCNQNCRCNYAYECFDEFYKYYGRKEFDEIDFDEIYINIKHPLTNKKLSVEEAIEIFFLHPVIEEKDVLRINGAVIEVEGTKMITYSLISEKVEELLLSGNKITSITINNIEIASSFVKIQYSHLLQKR